MTDQTKVFIGAGVIAIAVTIAILVNAEGDDTTQPRARASATVGARQALYDAFLGTARSDLRTSDPAVVCEPDYWLLVAEQVDGATGGDRAILQHAMADACHEAGYLPGATNYSPYYPD
jgi:hypothetical protein